MSKLAKRDWRLSAATSRLLALILLSPGIAAAASAGSPEEAARAILEETGVQGGVIVHLGCGDGRLTAALHTHSGYLVQGLDTDPANVEEARERIQRLGLYGPVSVARWRGGALPYIDGLVNLVVSEEPAPMDEVIRVLAPDGVAYVKADGTWTKRAKARPEGIDEWTHYLHDATNNAVGGDTVVGPPRRMQWVGGPKYSRHHDRMSSVSAAVTAGGRVFYIFDEAPSASILLPPRWSVIARDAFNGTILWKRRMGKWHDHLWPLKSGPAQLPRRLVADRERVYVTLALGEPFVALDAATGEKVRTYEETAAAEEGVFVDGVLFVVCNNIPGGTAEVDRLRRRGIDLPKVWDEAPRTLMAVNADSASVLWLTPDCEVPEIFPLTLAVHGGRLHGGLGCVLLSKCFVEFPTDLIEEFLITFRVFDDPPAVEHDEPVCE